MYSIFSGEKDGKSASEEEEEKIVLTLLHVPHLLSQDIPYLGESAIVQWTLPLSELYWIGRSA